MQLYNSLSGKKELFQPLEDNKIKLYVCGVTVYDDCHIGHARTFVAFDNIARYFRYKGYALTYVRNITDIDDKIIKRANEDGISTAELVKRTIASMYADYDRLNMLRPDFEPRATQTIDPMIAMIKSLIDKGYAYVTACGDVYYRVEKFSDYGRLSKQDLHALRHGERVEVAKDKESALDFVLWKAAKAHEPSWSSPWGDGRPGWHIECSAMSKAILGDTFDIHAGGSDLKFPHHENEIAQSEAANGCQFARYWLHSGMVQVNKEKMSKSLGNFFTIKEVLSKYQPEVVRYFLLSGHYRSELNYAKDNLDQAKAALDRLYTAIRGIKEIHELPQDHREYIEAFEKAMDNDFNVPEALPVLFSVAKQINRYREGALETAGKYMHLLLKLADVLGLLNENADAYFAAAITSDLSSDAIEGLIAERSEAKKNKDYAKADAIREQLALHKVILEDSVHGTSWKRG
ncbi:MAG: cysteine--tRNA ligase [Francisellaceae bacterium]